MANTQKHHDWMIKFTDSLRRSTDIPNALVRLEADNDLKGIFYQMNLEVGEKAGMVDSMKPFLLVDVDTYTYYYYFKLRGEGSEGYSRHMFNQSNKKPMRGAKLFTEKQYKIVSTTKGKSAWREFEKLLDKGDFNKCNEFTRNIALKRKQLRDAIQEGPDVGSKEYDSLQVFELLIDMERKFKGREIRSLFDYIELLDENKNDIARFKKVFFNHTLFERAMNYRLVKAEDNLIQRPLKEYLIEFIQEDVDGRSIQDVRERIRKSKQEPMIKKFFDQFFQSKNKKKNTMMIEGVTNSGKTTFFELLMQIIPCEFYIQQHKSNFAIDYTKSKTYDHLVYKAGFIIVDEGAYGDLFDHGHISDAKLFFEGKGKALQLKGITGKGMCWVGVPVLIAANHIHHFMEQEPFDKPMWGGARALSKWKEEEGHRKAMQTRIEYACLNEEFPGGDGNFPFDAQDLAHYLLSLFNEGQEEQIQEEQFAMEESNRPMPPSQPIDQLNQIPGLNQQIFNANDYIMHKVPRRRANHVRQQLTQDDAEVEVQQSKRQKLDLNVNQGPQIVNNVSVTYNIESHSYSDFDSAKVDQAKQKKWNQY